MSIFRKIVKFLYLEYYYNSEKAVRDGVSPGYAIHPPMPMPENIYNNKMNKYNCSECGIDFRHSNDLYNHKNRFHQGRYLNGDLSQGQNVGETSGTESAAEKFEEQKDEPIEVKTEPNKANECESEDEQIDVVTMKVEEESGEQNVETE